MRLIRVGAPGQERPAVLTEDPSGGIPGQAWDASSVTADYDAEFWTTEGPARLRDALAAGQLPALDLSGLRIGAPVTRPGNLVCIGMNYAAHAAESGAAPPTIPVVFLKPTNTVVGPDDAAPIPPLSERYDWEVELAVIVSQRLSYAASPEEAARAIGGYAVANDLSERDYQLPGAAGQWTKGKSLPASTPLGPWLVLAEDIDASDLRLRSWINGEPRQDSSTADLIFKVPFLLHHLSQYMVLEPGDVVLTGTPEGVALSGRFPYLQDGDVAELEIAGLGRMRQEFYRAVPGSTQGSQSTQGAQS
ncbi:fumarylacetoacetate hydrolase family protein [Psychromicrobium xiongbiense]|uniref:fumarylacetoacetate hydrolase family protein n=1 Tax=Psychromicrobium xiongbiense TaxID=3051184 RepID=UPI002557B5C2|nr:fumarylacetoacetate hydrolase family protein [Psychromicrobium sp. YIM S02556]